MLEIEYDSFLISPYEYTIKEILFDLAKDSFRNKDFVKRKHFGFIPENVISVGMILLMQNFSENFNADFYRSEAITICLDNELHLEAIVQTYNKLMNKLTIYELNLGSITKFRDEAKRLLNVQLKRPKLITPKKRTRTVNARFATGIPVTDNEKLMFGVIIGWDKNYNLFNDTAYKEKCYFGGSEYFQTYYIVLLKNGTTCYVPEENLIFYDEPLPDTLYEIWKYFTGYNGIFYKPNKELLSEYPDDEKIRKQFYRVYEGRKKKTLSLSSI
ncbi:hypothetical protein Avbf_18171 [Armadillidium vulgare]|nr:hypothetical protein Avbf_18171 [Armadillidium vulgare]